MQLRKDSPVYGAWRGMIERCTNPKMKLFPRYGGCGVTVCESWAKDFRVFEKWAYENGWKPGLQLDKDILCEALGISPKVYSPKTCQFVTQQNNLTQSASRTTFGSNKNIKFPQETVDAMNTMYAAGATKLSVSKHFNVSRAHTSRLVTTRQRAAA